MTAAAGLPLLGHHVDSIAGEARLVEVVVGVLLEQETDPILLGGDRFPSVAAEAVSILADEETRYAAESAAIYQGAEAGLVEESELE